MKLLTFLLLFVLSFSALAQNVNETRIVFIGDSLSAGYGVAKQEGYVEVLKSKLATIKGKNFKLYNGSVSGSTTSSLLSRLRWFKKYDPQLLVIALGANDGLRGTKLSLIKNNLKAGIEMAKKEGMQVLLAGMLVPPNYGAEYAKGYAQLYKDLVKEHSIHFLPFLLEGVAGEKSLNQDDGIHPNPKGHKIMANIVFAKLTEIFNVKAQ